MKELIWGIGEVLNLIFSEFPVVKWIMIILIALIVLIIFKNIIFKQKKEKRTRMAINQRMAPVETIVEQVTGKKGWVAALLNLIIPGAGFIYLEKFGIFFFALFSTIFLMVIFLPLGIILWLIWIGIGYFSAVPKEVKKEKKELDESRIPFSQMDKQTKWTYIIGIIIGILVCLALLIRYIVVNL